MLEDDYDQNDSFENIGLSEEEFTDFDSDDDDDDEPFDGVLKEFDEFNKEFPFFIEKVRSSDGIKQVFRMIKPRFFQIYFAADEEEGENVFTSNRMAFNVTSFTSDQVVQVKCQDLSDHLNGPDDLKIKLELP